MLQITKLSTVTTRFLLCQKFSRSTPDQEDRSISIPKPQNEKQQKLREEFFLREVEHERRVDYNLLSSQEKLIHGTHNEAVRRYHFTYDDPETGLKVITRLRHFLKGICCGNACRKLNSSFLLFLKHVCLVLVTGGIRKGKQAQTRLSILYYSSNSNLTRIFTALNCCGNQIFDLKKACLSNFVPIKWLNWYKF